MLIYIIMDKIYMFHYIKKWYRTSFENLERGSIYCRNTLKISMNMIEIPKLNKIPVWKNINSSQKFESIFLTISSGFMWDFIMLTNIGSHVSGRFLGF